MLLQILTAIVNTGGQFCWSREWLCELRCSVWYTCTFKTWKKWHLSWFFCILVYTVHLFPPSAFWRLGFKIKLWKHYFGSFHCLHFYQGDNSNCQVWFKKGLRNEDYFHQCMQPLPSVLASMFPISFLSVFMISYSWLRIGLLPF